MEQLGNFEILHEDNKKDLKQNNLNKAFDVLNVKSDLDYLVDIIKSDVSAAFGYGEGAEAIHKRPNL